MVVVVVGLGVVVVVVVVVVVLLTGATGVHAVQTTGAGVVVVVVVGLGVVVVVVVVVVEDVVDELVALTDVELLHGPQGSP